MLKPSVDKALEAIFGPLDPALEFRYFAEIDGIVEASFTECTGIRAERQVIPIHEGGANDSVTWLPGRTTYGNVTLRKGIMMSTKLWDWFAEGARDGKVARHMVTITQYSSYLNLPCRWYYLYDAFPVSWVGPDLRAESSGVAFESIELAFSYLEAEPLPFISAMSQLPIPI